MVDDEAFVGQAVSELLHREGYTTRHVFSGEEALDVLGYDRAYGLVLMDIRLGTDKMNGGEAAGRIWSEYRIPVLFYSGYTDEQTLGSTDDTPSYGYVQKTIRDTGVLVRSIKSALLRHDREKELAQSSERNRRAAREAHHRIKNNLFVLATRLTYEGESLPERCRDFAERATGHVHAIEKLHGLLQDTEDEHGIDLRDYVEEVLQTVLTNTRESALQFVGEPGVLVVSGKVAAPIGMIVTEIALNSAKHNPTSGTSIRFHVEIGRATSESQGFIRICTDGRPIDDDIALETKGAGIGIVRGLVRQIEGTLSVRRAPHPEFVLQIPLAKSSR